MKHQILVIDLAAAQGAEPLSIDTTNLLAVRFILGEGEANYLDVAFDKSQNGLEIRGDGVLNIQPQSANVIRVQPEDHSTHLVTPGPKLW